MDDILNNTEEHIKSIPSTLRTSGSPDQSYLNDQSPHTHTSSGSSPPRYIFTGPAASPHYPGVTFTPHQIPVEVPEVQGPNCPAAPAVSSNTMPSVDSSTATASSLASSMKVTCLPQATEQQLPSKRWHPAGFLSGLLLVGIAAAVVYRLIANMLGKGTSSEAASDADVDPDLMALESELRQAENLGFDQEADLDLLDQELDMEMEMMGNMDEDEMELLDEEDDEMAELDEGELAELEEELRELEEEMEGGTSTDDNPASPQSPPHATLPQSTSASTSTVHAPLLSPGQPGQPASTSSSVGQLSDVVGAGELTGMQSGLTSMQSGELIHARDAMQSPELLSRGTSPELLGHDRDLNASPDPDFLSNDSMQSPDVISHDGTRSSSGSTGQDRTGSPELSGPDRINEAQSTQILSLRAQDSMQSLDIVEVVGDEGGARSGASSPFPVTGREGGTRSGATSPFPMLGSRQQLQEDDLGMVSDDYVRVRMNPEVEGASDDERP